MDGLSTVAQRIGEIQTRLSTLAPSTAPPPPAAAPGAFRAALSAAGAAVSAVTTEVAAAAAPLGAPSAAWNRTAALAHPAGASPTPRLGAHGVPVDLLHYGNGKIPAAALEPIGRGGHRLWAPAAKAFAAMEAAAARDGVRFGVTDSYRSFDAQVDVAARKGLYSQGGLAAKPGTSDHGWGRSLDLDLDGAAQRWVRAHAKEYGFVEDTPREPWHWTYTPAA